MRRSQGLALGLVVASVLCAAAAPASSASAAAAAAGAASAPAASGSGAADSSSGGIPPILDPSAPVVVTQDVFVLVPQGPAVRVEELAEGANRSGAAVQGLVFPLPPGAVGAALEAGAPASAFSADSSGMHLALTLPPGGTVDCAFTYTVSWSGGDLWLPVAYPTGTLYVLVPHGRWRVSGPGFARSGRLPLPGRLAVDAYVTVAPSTGALLPVRVRAAGAVSRTTLGIAAGAAALAAAAAGVLTSGRRRRAARQARQASLVDEVARLDLAHGRGELQGPAYLDRRQALLEELQALHGG